MSSDVAPKRALSPEDRKRFKTLFEKLDINKDGKIEVNELAKGLTAQKTLKAADVAGQAKVFKTPVRMIATVPPPLNQVYPTPFVIVTIYCTIVFRG